MPKTAKKFTAWSASRLATHEKCPRQAKYKHLDKLDEGPKGAALEYGNIVHKAAENYIAHRTNELHEGLKKIKKLLDRLRALYKKRLVRVEAELAFTKEWKPTHWFADDVYVRVKIDALELSPDGKTCRVYDWKTGKFKNQRRIEEDDDALNLYAVGALSTGLAKEATAELVYTVNGKSIKRPKGTVSLPVLKENQQAWDKRARPMLNDKHFATRPGNHCTYCPYTANIGGPCEF